MSPSNVMCPETGTYHNGAVTAVIVQQGTGNAARDINKAGRDINNITNFQLCYGPKPAPSSIIPFSRDKDFVSHDSLSKLRQICDEPAGRAALVGIGGVGKSQIAIELAYRMRDAWPTPWVFWVHAGTYTRFEEGYRRIAEATKMDGWDDPKLDVMRLVRSWLCDESNGRWVLVVDNADDADVLFSPPGGSRTANLLSDFIPYSSTGSVLITSRSRKVAYKMTGSMASIFEVRPMDESDALALLQKKLLQADADAEAGTAKELVQALDCMPLAITQAAAFIVQRAPRMSLARYLSKISSNDGDRALLLEQASSDSRRDRQASNSIIATWQISFEHIRRDAPTAARLLSLMSLSDCQGIPESVFQNKCGMSKVGAEANFDEDIHTLMNYSLVESSGAKESKFKMHRLVQYSMRKSLELSGELEAYQESYVVLMDSNFPEGRHENWKTCQELLPHAQAAINYRPDDSRTKRKALEAWASLLFKVAWYVSEMGQYKVAKEMSQSALGVRERLLGHEHPDTLLSMNNLASELNRLGEYEESEAMHRQTLAIRQRLLGLEALDTLTSMNNLASVLSRRGKHKEAEAKYRQALSTFENMLEPLDPRRLASMNNLAGVLYLQGEYGEAEAMHRKRLVLEKEAFGPKHPDVLVSMTNLALALGKQGKHDEAEALYGEVVSIGKEVLSGEHPDVLLASSNLAVSLDDRGEHEKAEAIHRQTLATREKLLGSEHPETLTSVHCLAHSLAKQYKFTESLALYDRASAGYSISLGLDHSTSQLCQQQRCEAATLRKEMARAS